MRADLHIHTQYSDGTLSPAQAARQAYDAGIRVLAACDHNTVDGCHELAEACAALGMQSVSGVEIDCLCGTLYLHVLGLHIDVTYEPLLALLRRCRSILDWMSDDLIAAMEADGQAVSTADFNVFVRDPAQGGWKGINYLAAHGFPGDYPACMELYGRYGIQTRVPWPQLDEVTRVIHAAGGKAILAHPGHRLPLALSDWNNALLQILNAGIDGVECYYPSHTAEITQRCLGFCNLHHLSITCGSDSHGGFARMIDGVLYAFGEGCRDCDDLQLKGIL